MNRFNLDEYRTRIIKCESKDLLIDAVSEMCNCAGYPYSDHMTIKDHADYTFLNGKKQLSHLLDIAAKRERSLQ